MPATRVGAIARGRPNYLAVAEGVVLSNDHPVISVALSKAHSTTIGIRANSTFSINIPSAEVVKVTDYCSLVSGHKVDKSRLFETF